MWPNIEWGDGSVEPKILTPPNHVVWKQMESLYKKGKAKSIGVSNCTIPVLIDLLAGCEIKPHVN
jgi:diketogulonate reductase-like aldo/keto reductase